jgi:hypothetical protein
LRFEVVEEVLKVGVGAFEVGGAGKRFVGFPAWRTLDDRFLGTVGNAESKEDGEIEDQGKVVDGEGEDTTGAEEVEGVGLGAEIEAVAFERDGATRADGIFEGKEDIFGLIDPDELYPLSEESTEFFRVVRIGYAPSRAGSGADRSGRRENCRERRGGRS